MELLFGGEWSAYSRPWIPWVELGDVKATFNPHAEVILLRTIVSELLEEGTKLWNEPLL
ncbi:LOW QUALITY PROTEIN: hypothetical protein PanWU01x14_175280 [Parasponia andersonii]|uniref:Uncharacterized protein n=1 Tax=Parasponia andersonii TaxID=3476 RepID=A0A2P5C8D3_PARAD|nr:LOW QUALITY PROTEIN: hypothetical protein PanWU01x14_175280 [Parasponia andersonii]